MSLRLKLIPYNKGVPRINADGGGQLLPEDLGGGAMVNLNK